MATKRKTTTAIVAGVAAAALLLGGTFAWTSISQQAKNETAGIVNVGGRLHDDFNGTNKDVYVENFTDPLNGGQPIYARIKLTEYMEVGSEAGQADNADRKATPVVNGTDINDKDNWPVHVPAALCTTCNTGDTCLIHDHWTWEMGGQTTFMPTFNKDKDSLAADINGTYHGTDDTDKIYYDNYVVYTTDATNGGNDIAFADKEAYDGEIYSVIGTEYYDNDTNTADDGGVREVTGVTHTAKLSADGSVITMDEWINTYNKAPGNYWVYDTDGWAYWANPIMPGEATGLLLSNIEMEKNPGEKCYYAINVVAQFATVGDWEYFDGTEENGVFDGTDAAKNLLNTVSKNVATVTVTNTGATILKPGESTTFSASVTVNGQQVLAASDFEWSVLNPDLTVSTTSTITDGVLTVGANEEAANLIIVAKAKDPNYLGALGMSSVAVNVPAPALTLEPLWGSEVVNLAEIVYWTQFSVYWGGEYLTDSDTDKLTVKMLVGDSEYEFTDFAIYEVQGEEGVYYLPLSLEPVIEQLSPDETYDITVTYTDGDISASETIQIQTILPTVTMTGEGNTQQLPVRQSTWFAINDGNEATNIVDLLTATYSGDTWTQSVLADLQNILQISLEGYTVTWGSNGGNTDSMFGTVYAEPNDDSSKVALFSFMLSIDEGGKVEYLAVSYSEAPGLNNVLFTVTHEGNTYTSTVTFLSE